MGKLYSLLGILLLFNILPYIYSIQANNKWHIDQIGSIKHVHYHYENQILQGIFVATQEGVVAYLDADSGQIKWRDCPKVGRNIQRFYAEDQLAIIISQNFTIAEIFDLKQKKQVKEVELTRNDHRIQFTDVHIIKVSENYLSYSLLSNNLVRYYENHEEKYRYEAMENETLVYTTYDFEKNSILVGSVYDNTEEMVCKTVQNQTDAPFTFIFKPDKDLFMKSRDYILAVRMKPEAKNTMIITHSLAGRDVLFNTFEEQENKGFKLKQFYLPSGLIVLESWSELSLKVMHDMALQDIQKVSKQDGEYGFGSDYLTTKAVMCQSNQDGYKMFLAEPKIAFRMIYNSVADKNSLNRMTYGEPEYLWVDSYSDRILLRTSDKSFHMIRGEHKIWTQQYGLHGVSKYLENTKNYYFLSMFSKVTAVDSQNGAQKWEKCAIGNINDIFLSGDKQNKLGIMIDLPNAKKTKIAEVTAEKGEKTGFSEEWKKFERIQAIQTQEIFGNQATPGMLLAGSQLEFKYYPDNIQKEIKESKSKILFYDVNQRDAIVYGYKVANNMSALQESWKIDFSQYNETIITIFEPTAVNGYRSVPQKLQQLNLKRYQQSMNIIIVVSVNETNNLIKFNFINKEDGKIIHIYLLEGFKLTYYPLIKYYDNALFISVLDLQKREFEQAKVIMIELYQSGLIGEGQDSRSEELVVIQTTLNLSWGIKGMSLIIVNNKEYFISINSENNLKFIETENIERKGITQIDENIVQTIESPAMVQFLPPSQIGYSESLKRVLVYGLDILSFELEI